MGIAFTTALEGYLNKDLKLRMYDLFEYSWLSTKATELDKELTNLVRPAYFSEEEKNTLVKIFKDTKKNPFRDDIDSGNIGMNLPNWTKERKRLEEWFDYDLPASMANIYPDNYLLDKTIATTNLCALLAEKSREEGKDEGEIKVNLRKVQEKLEAAWEADQAAAKEEAPGRFAGAVKARADANTLSEGEMKDAIGKIIKGVTGVVQVDASVDDLSPTDFGGLARFDITLVGAGIPKRQRQLDIMAKVKESLEEKFPEGTVFPLIGAPDPEQSPNQPIGLCVVAPVEMLYEHLVRNRTITSGAHIT